MPSEATLPELLERSARLWPDHVAVEEPPHEGITYRELDRDHPGRPAGGRQNSLWILGYLGLLFLVPGFHRAAMLLLATGLTLQTARMIAVRQTEIG